MSAKEQQEEAPIKPYSKTELADLYGISHDTLDAWLRRYEKELKKIGYYRYQKILTVAQVKFLFKDENLGRP